MQTRDWNISMYASDMAYITLDPYLEVGHHRWAMSGKRYDIMTGWQDHSLTLEIS